MQRLVRAHPPDHVGIDLGTTNRVICWFDGEHCFSSQQTTFPPMKMGVFLARSVDGGRVPGYYPLQPEGPPFARRFD